MNRDDQKMSVTSASPAVGGARAFRRRGFTLIELLMVIVVIGVLAGILLSAFSRSRHQAKRRRALAEMSEIKNAIVVYHLEMRNWPDPAVANEVYSNNNSVIVGSLTNRAPTLLDTANLRLDPSSGNVLDPWLRPYVIRVDKDNDGSVEPDGVSVISTSPENR